MIRLSPRETEAARLLLEALSNKEIAERMDVSIHTVKEHLRTISLKCGIWPLNRIKLATVLLEALK